LSSSLPAASTELTWRILPGF